MVLAVSIWWAVGWVLAVVVVLLAASLLLIIILLGRKIVGQAEDITRALDGARTHTEPLYEVARTNLAVDRIARGLATVREDGQR